MSSPRKQGPIVTVVHCCEGWLPECYDEGAVCMGPRFRGDDDGLIFATHES